MPITVLHFITGLGGGGAERMLARLVTASDPAAFRHRVVSILKADTPTGHAIAEAGVPVTSLDARLDRPSPLPLLRALHLWRAQRPDVVMTWLYHADLLGTLIRPFAPSAPLVWNIRRANTDLTGLGAVTAMLPRILARLSHRPAAVAVNSQAGLRAHSHLGYRPRSWKVLPNGFDTEVFRPNLSARAALRRELGLPQTALVVGLIARFHPDKDHVSFLSAMAQLTRANPDLHVVAAGAGVTPASLAAANPLARIEPLANRLHALNERLDVANVTAALDIAVLSSRTEGFPNAIGEAMSCGVPVVATDVGDTAMLVGDKAAIVPAGQPRALAEAVQRLVDLPAPTRQAVGARARQRITEHFSLDRAIELYEALFSELAGRG